MRQVPRSRPDIEDARGGVLVRGEEEREEVLDGGGVHVRGGDGGGVTDGLGMVLVWRCGCVVSAVNLEGECVC